MCIAIVNKAGKTIPTAWLESCFEGNPDGAGFAYIKEGKVQISKGYMDMKSFLIAYDGLTQTFGQDNPMLVHCRIATAGRVNKGNCHPFPIKGGALIHNGTLWSVTDGFDAKKSDTREFAEMFYNILDYGSVVKAVASGEFTDAIGYDKMAMLYDDGRFALAGNWYEEDCALFSNTGYGHAPVSSYYMFEGLDDWDYRSTYN